MPVLEERCVFTGEPAVAIALSDKEGFPPGRAFRQHVPMLTGEDVINFYPGGDAGLPISGIALLCIQAFPLGCAKCGGKLLAVHSDNPDLMLKFAAKFLDANRRQVDLARSSGSTKLTEAGSSAKTLLVETLIEIERARRDAQEEQHPYSVTAYHWSNFGQTPSLEMYHLPLELTRFLGAIVHIEYKNEWQAIEHRAWWVAKKRETLPVEEKPRKRKPKLNAPDREDITFRRNLLYEDLFRLPNRVRHFIRRYFLSQSPGSTSWKLTELLMKEVIHMDRVTIEEIRQLGDKLGEYVQTTGDKQFYSAFFSETRYDHFRDLLMRVNRRRLKSAESPIITLDEFFSVFESEWEGIPRYDRWKLARDLVLIAMTDYLDKAGRLKDLADAVPDVQELDEEDQA
jgi:CRISPR-associated protein Cst1